MLYMNVVKILQKYFIKGLTSYFWTGIIILKPKLYKAESFYTFIYVIKGTEEPIKGANPSKHGRGDPITRTRQLTSEAINRR